MKLKIAGRFLKDVDAEFLNKSGFGYNSEAVMWEREINPEYRDEHMGLAFLVQRLVERGYEVMVCQ